MPKLTKKLRDFHTLGMEIKAELAQLQIESPEQLAALCVESFEDGFTTGLTRGGIKTKDPKTPPPKKRRKKRKISPKLAALNLHRKVRKQIIETLGERSMSRGQLEEATGLDAKTISACIQKEKGRWFIATPGHRWRVNPEHQRSEKKLRKTRQKARKAVANGDRMVFKAIIAKVMGKKTMGPKGVLEALKAKGADLPESKNLLNYVNYTLAQHTDVFERIGRGSISPSSWKSALPSTPRGCSISSGSFERKSEPASPNGRRKSPSSSPSV
jgi:hypothetical protein